MPHSTKTRQTKKSTGKTRKTRTTVKRTVKAKGSTASPKTKQKANKKPITARSIVNYSVAQRWLYEHIDYERMRIVPYNSRTFSLERMRKLLSALDNPHQQLRCVQVAGTKGKGSTCAMLSSMLRECGYTVGVFSSPHLIDLAERISIDGQIISHGDLTDVFRLIASKERLVGTTPPSFFELLTAAALYYFADQAVDIALLETGLGGRLDSTTVVTPLVTGMAHISLDHTNVLGNSLTQIAREKAGIFKKGVPAVSVEQDPAVAEVLSQVAEEVDAPLTFTQREIDFSYRFEASRELGPHTRVCLATKTSRWDHLAVPLDGEHQAHNCGLALAMLDCLKAHEFQVPEEQVISGLAKTTIPGRMEKVWDQPRVIIDGAHNAASITALIRALGAHIPYDSLVMIFGCGQDKDTDGMLQQIALGADKVIFTRAKANRRAHEPDDLMNRFNQMCGKMAQAGSSLTDALQLAERAVSREDLIIITGSFYLAGEARKHFLNKKKKLAY